MRPRSPRRLLTLALTVALVAMAATGTAVAAQKLNAYALQGDFICVSCHEPLNQVSSPESQSEKQTLASLVSRGLTLAEIKKQMVADYGEAVLAEPPGHGLNLLVYILPPAFVVLGLGFLAYNLPRWRRRAQAAAQNAPVPEMPLDPADEQRLNEELKSFDA